MQDLPNLILLLVLAIPAVFISIVIFIYFATHRRERSKPQNHVWLIILVVSFLQITIHIPMSIDFYYIGQVWPATNSYCVWWNWFEYLTTGISLILMACASIQRHFFIFYPTFMVGGAWKKWMYHRLPIILCILWVLLWYFVLIVISPSCTTIWNFGFVICGSLPCYITGDDAIFDICGILDVIFNIVIPLGILLLANIALIIRVICEKISRHQNVDWRRHRKMAFQLWFISTLYLAGWLPIAITLLVRIIANPSFLDNQLADMIYTLNFIPLLLPFVCLGAFPEITKSIREFFQKNQHRNQVGTGSIALNTVTNREQ